MVEASPASGRREQQLFTSHSQDQLPLCDMDRLREAVAVAKKERREVEEGLYSPLKQSQHNQLIGQSQLMNHHHEQQLLNQSEHHDLMSQPHEHQQRMMSQQQQQLSNQPQQLIQTEVASCDQEEIHSSEEDSIREEEEEESKEKARKKSSGPFTVEGAMDAFRKRRASLKFGRRSSDEGKEEKQSGMR